MTNSDFQSEVKDLLFDDSNYDRNSVSSSFEDTADCNCQCDCCTVRGPFSMDEVGI